MPILATLLHGAEVAIGGAFDPQALCAGANDERERPARTHYHRLVQRHPDLAGVQQREDDGLILD